VGYSATSINVTTCLLLPYLENKVSHKALCIVCAVGWHPYPVPMITPPHEGRDIHPHFMDDYTKLNIWKLDEEGVYCAVYLEAE
ncbi:hypothetical protein K438DRAFT_1441439, partial [Mycena galopus ATCC 62051]